MHSLKSGLANGTSASPQTSLEQNEYADNVASNEQKAAEEHQMYLREKLPNSSPISIPESASVTEQHKTGYEQVKYRWKQGDFKYEARWHSKTPNAPIGQGDSWVVVRTRSGVGNGPKARRKTIEVLVGKRGRQNVWAPKEKWDEAIRAKKNGTATKEQKEMLDNGHWKA